MKRTFSTLLIVIVSLQLLFAQKDSTNSSLKFDFGLTRDKNINLWPVFKYTNEAEMKDLQVFYPIYRNQRNLADSSKKSHLFPFYWNYKDSVSTDKRLLSLYYPSVFRIQNNDTSGVKSYSFMDLPLDISLLKFSKSKDGTFVENNLLFFLWAKNDVANQSSHLVCFPLYWSFKEKDRKSNTFFPFYSYGSYNYNENKYLTISPLYWQHESPDSKKQLLFPIYYKRKNYYYNDTTQLKTLFPIYWSYENRYKKTQAMPPLIWRTENQQYKSFTFAPLYSQGMAKDSSRSCRMLGSLYWQFNKTNGKDRLLLPIIWNRKRYYKSDTTSFTTAFPVYWSYKDNKKNNKVVFPLIWSLKNPNSKSFTFAPLVSTGKSSKKNRQHLMLASLYWDFKSDNGKTKLMLPFYVNNTTYKSNDTTRFKTVFPVYYAYNDKTTDNKVVFPLYWNFDSELYQSKSLFPFYSKGGSKVSEHGYNMIAMMHWRNYSPTEKSSVTFPVHWKKTRYLKDDTTQFQTIFPIYWSYKDNDEQNRIAFPLVWSFKNPDYKSTTILPIYSSKVSSDGKQRQKMLAMMHWKKQSPEKMTSLTVPFHYKKEAYFDEDTTKFETYFPLYWTYDDMEISNKIFFPFLWSFNNHSLYKSVTVPPLFSYGISADSLSKHQMVAMLHWKTQTPEQTKSLTIPIHWKREQYFDEDTTKFETYFPLYWAYDDMETSNKIVFPIVWAFKNSLYKSVTVPPFYSTGISADSSSRHKMVAMLHWKTQTPEQTKSLTIPVHWKKEQYFDEDTTCFETVFPIYWGYEDMEIKNRIVFPFVWSFNNYSLYKSLTIPPFYSKGISADSLTKHRMIAMLHWQTKTTEQTKTLTLPFHWKKEQYAGEDTTCFQTYPPFVWSYEDMETSNKIVFPVVWSFQNSLYKSVTIPPFFSKGISADSLNTHRMIGMLHWQTKTPEQKKSLLFPVHWKREKYFANDTTVFKTLFPIYWSCKNKRQKNSVVFPIVWNYNNSLYKSFTVAPLYSQGISVDSRYSHRMIAMLYWQKKSPESKKSIALPIFYKNERYFNDDTSTFKTCFPVYWAYKDNETNNQVFFPLAWRLKNADYKSLTIAPLYSNGKSTDKQSSHKMIASMYWNFKDKNKSTTTFLPIYYQRKRFYDNDTATSKTFFPIYWANKDNNKNNKVVFPLVWSLKNEKHKSFTVAPFYSSGESTDKQSSHKMVASMYWNFKDENKSTTTFLPIYYQRKRFYDNDTATSNTVFPIYWANKDNSKNNKVVFPIVWSLKNEKHKSFTFLPFYSKGAFANSDYTAITPLFWKFTNEENSKIWLFPFFSKKLEQEGDKNSNLLLFVYRHKKEGQRNATHLLWPLCESSKDSTSKYFRFAPVVWYKKTEKSKMFSIQPLYYVKKTDEFENHHVLWQLYTSKNQYNYKKSNNILWKVFYTDKYANNDYETRFLHLVYADVKKDGKTEKSIFPLFHSREDAKGNESKSFLLYFYSKFKRRIGETDDFYHEEKIFWFIRLRSNFKQLQREGKIDKRLS